VVALIYIDRIIESRNVVLTALNVHRLLITSLMLAAKFFDDLFYNNAFYAKLGTPFNHVTFLLWSFVSCSSLLWHFILPLEAIPSFDRFD
jgi:hypothetical protein